MACLWTRRRGVPLRCGDPPQDGQRAIDFLLSQMPALNGCLCRLTQGQVRANGRPFKVAEAIPASLFMNSGFEDRHGKYAAGKKRIRRNTRRAEINGKRIGRIRIYVKKVEAALSAGDKDAASAAIAQVQPELARGVAKGVLHKNTAWRKFSRLTKAVAALG